MFCCISLLYHITFCMAEYVKREWNKKSWTHRCNGHFMIGYFLKIRLISNCLFDFQYSIDEFDVLCTCHLHPQPPGTRALAGHFRWDRAGTCAVHTSLPTWNYWAGNFRRDLIRDSVGARYTSNLDRNCSQDSFPRGMRAGNPSQIGAWRCLVVVRGSRSWFDRDLKSSPVVWGGDFVSNSALKTALRCGEVGGF